jgi:peptide/nickel transport system ATP-binding protein
MTEPLLRASGLGKDYSAKKAGYFSTPARLVAVDQIDLELRQGETLGLVGESGCGKTTLGRLLCCLENPTRGEIWFSGQPLGNLRSRELRGLRHRFQPVFQDPLGSLNPRLSAQATVAEPLRLLGRQGQPDEVMQLLTRVGLGPEVLSRYPHQLSGGQRQRLGLARALAMSPELLVADEPVSSLDVSIQAQILNLFLSLQRELSLTVLFISHDLRVVSHLADRVAVMYLGRIMELAPAETLFSHSRHPYTLALLQALPQLSPGRGRRRALLTGDLPSPVDPAPGCRFYNRCQFSEPSCRNYENELLAAGTGHWTACRRWEALPTLWSERLLHPEPPAASLANEGGPHG